MSTELERDAEILREILAEIDPSTSPGNRRAIAERRFFKALEQEVPAKSDLRVAGDLDTVAPRTHDGGMTNSLLTHTKRRDELQVGDTYKSSAGYDLLVVEIQDNAENRTDARYIGILGRLHGKVDGPIRAERYPASSTVEVYGGKIDVYVENHGSIFLFRLNTGDARTWVDENVSDDAQFLGGALAVEHRYAFDISTGMINSGLEVR